MSNIKYKVFLDNDTKGVQQIQEPTGMKDLQIELERNIEDGFFGLIQLFAEQTLGFYGDAKDYLQDVLDTDGIDGEARIDIDISTDGGVAFSDYFDGVVDFDGFDRVDDQELGLIINARINESGFYQKIKSHLDTKIDINGTKDIAGGTRETINLQSVTLFSQTIRFQYDADDSGINIGPTAHTVSLTTLYFENQWQTENLIELRKITNDATEQITTTQPTDTLYTIDDDKFVIDTVITMEGTLTVTVSGGAINISTITAQWFFQRNSDAEVAIGAQTSSSPGTVGVTLAHTIASSSAFYNIVPIAFVI